MSGPDGLPQSQLTLLRAAEQLGLRGAPDDALAELRRSGTELPAAVLAGCAALLAGWGGSREVARGICDTALAMSHDAATRGRTLLSRARVAEDSSRRWDYTAALTECGAAGDLPGQAMALAGLSCPRPAEGATRAGGMDRDSHARLGRDALRLATASGDAEAIAVCTGNLAAAETFLGRPAALRRWQRAAELHIPPGIAAAEAISLNYANWALAAIGYGEYAMARRVLYEGGALARGAAWRRTFATLDALLAWRTDGVTGALTAVDAIPGAGPAVRAGALGAVVAGGAALERERRPPLASLVDAARSVSRESDQLSAIARATLARARSACLEPDPARGLDAALGAVALQGRRFGWEDLALALVDVGSPAGRATVGELDELWPPGPRGEAARLYTGGVLAGTSGQGLLVAAAERFLALPEPLTAALALHAAARVAPSVAAGNRLRVRALELFARHGADRSVATLLRERRLRRSPDLPRVPANLRNTVSAGLTQRERDVAALVRSGMTAVEISEQLSLSVGTVRNHIARIREKFGGVSKRRLAGLLADTG